MVIYFITDHKTATKLQAQEAVRSCVLPKNINQPLISPKTCPRSAYICSSWTGTAIFLWDLLTRLYENSRTFMNGKPQICFPFVQLILVLNQNPVQCFISPKQWSLSKPFTCEVCENDWKFKLSEFMKKHCVPFVLLVSC